ncbi:hypothetical protein N7509_007647 [Penicillium cosmopolitanum]|uniref:Uncharacterized protein n=1 Tax=Penicillium cosmopolitanum TaxID=1131564 RepID=A0A9W9VZ98_9EURO|nr:uncharacterized protein N7509_007647 [Penicillium cosmopolitanum]KAJ5392157.1 hypothetical protein N7509_007647 [Penicillium cosmopolitanum]
MRLLPRGLGNSQPRLILLFLLVIVIAARVSAQKAGDKTTETNADVAQTTDDRSTSDSTSTSTPSSEKTTTTMDTTTTSSTSSTETSTSTTDSTSTTSSVSTTTTSTSSSTTTTGAPIVTVPPTANAPYMQTTNTPEGTVFIAVGAALGLIGLAVLAWRGMVAWSVNRSVRRAAMAQSESKRLLRGSRKKRSTVYTPAPATDVSLEKLGAATRASYKPSSKRGPSGGSGLFYSPTAGGAGAAGAGSHHSLNATTNNRGSTYLPPGFYTAAGNNSTSRDSIGGAPNTTAGGYPPNSSTPSLPPTGPGAGAYYDAPHNARQSYVGASTSSLNLSQAPQQGRAPSAYLEDLFENHSSPPPRRSDRRER